MRLFCGTRFVRAHRMLLAALSPVLGKIFKDVDPFHSKELDISLPDLAYPDLEALVAFLYTGVAKHSKKRCRTIKKWLSVPEINIGVDENSVNLQTIDEAEIGVVQIMQLKTKEDLVPISSPFQATSRPSIIKSNLLL